MSINLNRLTAGFATTFALFITLLATMGAVTPAHAADGPFYTAELVQPTDETTLVAGGVAWSCKGTKCIANRGPSRPLRICRKLQRDVGEIAAFTADGEKLTEERLASCNK